MTITRADRTTSFAAATVEREAHEIGRALFAEVGRGPSLFERGWWDDRVMDLTMGNPEVKTQLFRFIDALPSLTSAEDVGRHLRDYLDQARGHVPWFMTLGVALAPVGSIRGEILASIARGSATHMARKFIAGSTPAEAFETVKELRKRGVGFTADLLGEAVISETEAEAYAQTCVDLLRGLGPGLADEPEIPGLDRAPWGPVPRVNLSLKLTSLTPRFDAAFGGATTRRVLERLRPILRVAREQGAFVNVDMEQYAHKDLTFSIFQQVMTEPEFRDWSDVGIVVQAYIPEAEADLAMLKEWAVDRGTPVTIRLVKGAYWDYEVLHARQLGWPVPVHLHKWQSDAGFERCSRFLMEHHEHLRPALGSHNIRSISYAMAVAEALRVPDNGYEIQMLHGMGTLIERALTRRGLRVRVYTPYGVMLPGMAYLVRRLLENTSNESFLKASTAGHAQVDELLRNPEDYQAMWPIKQQPKPSGPLGPFRNEPATDFTRPEARSAIRNALEAVRRHLEVGPYRCPIVIDGEEWNDAPTVEVASPGDKTITVSRTGASGRREADHALAAARKSFDAWSETPATDRADILLKVASIFRRDRFELATIQGFECGKAWTEADGDVTEAIDFCEFYAREMVRLADPVRRDVPGETNAIERIARGVVVVIPPWNFPLAIPTGMTAAALVAGNTVVLKPAEQSPVMAYRLFEAFREAGLPSDVYKRQLWRRRARPSATLDKMRTEL